MAWTKTYTGVEPMRINKWLAQEGVCSRREAEALIADGAVRINGALVEDPGRKIEAGQTLILADMGAAPALTAILNKPVGYVSAQPEPGQVPAARLLNKATLIGAAPIMPTSRTSLAPLGRLDQDSRGLLLLSEDGVLARAVIGEESKVDKEYLVQVAGPVSDRKLASLRHGLALDGRKLRLARVVQVAPQRLQFILTEGRKRQIRRMCALVDLDVADLLRVRIGPIRLGDLPEGRWRSLTSDERAAMLNFSA